MAYKKTKKKFNGYTAREEDILRFAEWALLVAFICLVIAAIITTSEKLMIYSVVVGIFIAYAMKTKMIR